MDEAEPGWPHLVYKDLGHLYCLANLSWLSTEYIYISSVEIYDRRECKVLGRERSDRKEIPKYRHWLSIKTEFNDGRTEATAEPKRQKSKGKYLLEGWAVKHKRIHFSSGLCIKTYSEGMLYARKTTKLQRFMSFLLSKFLKP